MKITTTFIKSAALAWMLVFAVATVSPVQAKSAPESFADLAERLLPAVVNISTTQVIESREGQGGQQMPQFPPGSPFEDFFKDFLDKNSPKGGKKQRRKATSLGSGFVIDFKK